MTKDAAKKTGDLSSEIARALRDAVEPDQRKGDAIPSTKGML